MDEEFLTTEEVAKALRTPIETVRYWRHANKGPKSFKIGRRVLYAAEDVERFVAEARSGDDRPSSFAQAVRVDCPYCGATQRGEIPINVTNYQPSGPPGTPRVTNVSVAKMDSRVLSSHDCLGS